MPFRFVTIGVVVLVLLGGLYSLMVPLRAPMLHVLPDDVVVSGCDNDQVDGADVLCPQLYCYRAVLLSDLIPRNSKLEMIRGEEHAEAGSRTWAGSIRASNQSSETTAFFRCKMRHDTVESFDVLTPEQWERMESVGGW